MASWLGGVHHRVDEQTENNDEEVISGDREDEDDPDLMEELIGPEDLSADDKEQPIPESSESDQGSQPLYSGATITLMESMLLILAYSMKHNLTGVALADLLMLISLHCLAPNLCRTTLYLFNKFFGDLRSPVVFHKFCGRCYFLIEGDTPLECSICKFDLTPQGSVCFFVEIPIIQQLQDMFLRPNFFDDLQYRFNRRKTCESNIEDIYDGRLYKNLYKNDGFLSSPNNISLMWYTDGVPLFKSSSMSLWPLYFSINELPYRKRMLKENMLIAGLWFGETKPCMSTYLKPFHDTFETLAEGFDACLSNGSNINVRCIVLCGTCDMPAKSQVLNMIQFNGKFGCCRCLQPGETAQSGKGHTHVYPYDACNPSGPARTWDNFCSDAEKAYVDGTRVNGVNGPCWMLYLCDIVRGTALDYMHQILLGVVRKLTHFWTDSSYHKEPYSLSKSLNILNKRLLSIKPPTFISRAPSSFSKLKFWKASEFRSFLFYYSVPVLYGVLPSIYFDHHILLVEAIHSLNSQSISPEAIDKCEFILQYYCALFAKYYGANTMGINVHSILHLTDVVRDLGPLFVYSCFPYESLNGDLKSLFHGTQAIEKQVSLAVSKLIKFPVLAMKMNRESYAGAFFQKLRGHVVPNGTKISENVYILGFVKYKQLTEEEMHAFRSCVIDINICNDRVLYFLRYSRGQKLFSSFLYKRQFVRNSTIVSVMLDDTAKFAQVQFFFKYPVECVCTTNTFPCSCTNYYAMVKLFEEVEDFNLAEDKIAKTCLDHIVICKPLSASSNLAVVPLSAMNCTCIFMEFKNQDQVFIAKAPNMLESD